MQKTNKQELQALLDNVDEEALKDYWVKMKEDQVVADLLKEILTDCQNPKPKSLEEKLVEAGFNQYNWEDSHTEYRKSKCSKIIIQIYKMGWVSVNGLESKRSDHDQIFADIKYLEGRK